MVALPLISTDSSGLKKLFSESSSRKNSKITWEHINIIQIFYNRTYAEYYVEYYVYFLCTIVSISIHIHFTKNFILLRRIFVPAISRVCTYVGTNLVRGYWLKIVPYGYKKNKRPSKKIPGGTTLRLIYLILEISS